MRIYAPLSCAIVASLLSCGSDVQTPGGECSDYLPRTPTWSEVTVRLKNSSPTTLYLGSQGGCGFEPFALKDEKGNPLLWQLGSCAQTCVALQNGSCACAADCALPPVFLIPAGGVFETSWKGSVFASAMMPASCFKDETCAPGGCLLEQAAPTGAIEVSGTLWDSLMNCPMGMPTCTCDPGTGGACLIPGAAMVGGAQHTATAKLSYPSSKLVEVVFQ